MLGVESLRGLYLRQPHEVSIETLALCNARCTFCPYPSLERIGTRLETETIFNLFNQMATWTEPFSISPFKVNEPFLDSRLEQLCKLALVTCENAKLRLFTNGQPLTSKNLDWVASLPPNRVHHLWVSLNSTDPQEYSALMGIKYEITQARLDALHDRLRQHAFPHVVVVSRVMGDDPRANMKFNNDVSRRWPYFVPFIIKRDAWIDFTTPTYGKVPNAPCGRWFELNITATGVAALCCMDGTGEYAIGDIHKSSLLEIYNQPHLLKRRELAMNRNGIEPCQRCSY